MKDIRKPAAIIFSAPVHINSILTVVQRQVQPDIKVRECVYSLTKPEDVFLSDEDDICARKIIIAFTPSQMVGIHDGVVEPGPEGIGSGLPYLNLDVDLAPVVKCCQYIQLNCLLKQQGRKLLLCFHCNYPEVAPAQYAVKQFLHEADILIEQKLHQRIVHGCHVSDNQSAFLSTELIFPFSSTQF